MFGPNTITDYYFDLTFSHRSDDFKSLYLELKKTILEKFSMQGDYDVVFIPGSGTTAVESVIRSQENQVEIIGNEGKFKNRWAGIATYENRHKAKKSRVSLYCLLETSNSSIFRRPGAIVDAIGAFPFYSVPDSTIALVTSSNKQLGAFPGLGIIFVRKDCWKQFTNLKDQFSSMNLGIYHKYSLENQTPATPPLQIYAQLLKTVKEFDIERHKDKIFKNSSILVDLLGKRNIIGEQACPVITVKKTAIPDNLATKHQIYHYNNNSEYYQIFTYSSPQSEYNKLFRDMADIKR